MAEDIRIWQITDSQTLKEIIKVKLDFESRLEEWIEHDISIISHDLILIGRQIETDFGGVIDVLCLDRNGDVVIIELKRDKTPRDITAQLLDYASWVKDLSNEKITKIADDYLGRKDSLNELFRNNFDDDPPDILNESHKMIVAASEIDDSTERIINYLSDTYGVAINAISFQYFKDDIGKEYLARTFLIEPSEVERKRVSKRKPPLTFEQFREIAEEKKVEDLFDFATKELIYVFEYRGTTRSTVSFSGKIGGSMKTLFNILPNESSKEKGLRFYVYIERLSEYSKTNRANIENFLPDNIEERRTWNVNSPALFGYFRSQGEIVKFTSGLKAIKS